MNMLRHELLFSLQIICPFSCCSEIRMLLSVALLPPAVSVEAVVGQGVLDLGQAQGQKEERVCHRAREQSSSGQHRLALSHWCQQFPVGSWIPSLAVPTTHFGGGQHTGEEEKEEEVKEEEEEGSQPVPEEVKGKTVLLWTSAGDWFLALLLLMAFPRPHITYFTSDVQVGASLWGYKVPGTWRPSSKLRVLSCWPKGRALHKQGWRQHQSRKLLPGMHVPSSLLS